MPFDGITTRAMAYELNQMCQDGKIQVISMPEKNEINMNIHAKGTTHKLVISMNPSAPSIYTTQEKKSNPLTPPNFCMFLRKHINGGRIVRIETPDYERLIIFHIINRNELGDQMEKQMIIELAGRICNVIIVTASMKILDAFKHIDNASSEKRSIMPARTYQPPPPQDKMMPDDFDFNNLDASIPLKKSLLNGIKGFSPVLCREIIHRAQLDPSSSLDQLNDQQINVLKNTLQDVLNDIIHNHYHPCVVRQEKKMIDFHCLNLTQYPQYKSYSTLNGAIYDFYAKKDQYERLNQKKASLAKVLHRNIERCDKKIHIHTETIQQSKSADQIKEQGELIIAHLHEIPKGAEQVRVLNYYTNAYEQIKLNPHKDGNTNAQIYFKKYKKLKSASEYAKKQLKKTQKEKNYLETILHNLEECVQYEDITDIKEEMIQAEYLTIKRKSKNKTTKKSFNPHHYVSSEGYEIFVGRNNVENDYLTFVFANSRDLWLHVKDIPGSHVIVRKKDKNESFFPDQTITEAGIIAAYHSKARNSGQVPVDYTEVKNVKKPTGSPPGMVNYFHYYSAYSRPNEEIIQKCSKQKDRI